MGAEVAVSPDGSRVVYSANFLGAESSRLYNQPLNQLDPQPIPGTELARNPIFSPNGEWVAFVIGIAGPSGGVFKKISVRGGPPQTLSDDFFLFYGG